ncbi:cytochrome c oxidase assembly factor 1 family protein [Xanthomonas sp. AM6]|uniref:cytochrome c oxidase assembly factor 1 family protein n=1 Tax=Xanthomonas sp. AM6 TaxID=2982531 RepID=UPI0021DAEF58|nr:cytochrome c oxidase assembly factor 1 family protein [Xanthomonas sp. AM6]UYB52714.1 cytochrome c oxidase assembly factor 1 family protein [Xanthomonas sp. AM6]
MSTPPPLPETPAAPPQPQPQPQPQLPAKRGWWSRHWKWMVPLLALLLGAMLLASIAVFVVGIARVTKSSEPYQVGLKAAQHDPRVLEALGAPVEDGIMPSGSISTGNGTGSANFSVSLHGARGNGTLYIEAERHAGEWHYTTLQVLPDAGEAIPLLDDASELDDSGETDVESDPEMDAASDAPADADPAASAEADSAR